MINGVTEQDLVAAFKETMRRLAATVTIVTTGGAGQRSGMTATTVISLCVDPPALLVCINRAASIHPSLSFGAKFCVNVLASKHADLAMLFGRKAEPEVRFRTGTWSHDEHDVPFFCRCCRNTLLRC